MIAFSGASAVSGFELFALLVMGHCVADFALQSDRMAVEKCPGHDHTLSWKWWLSAHAGIHGFFVAVISGFVWLGLAEWVAHILIDYGKCRHRYSLGVDQMLHAVCKILWVLAIWLAGELGPARLIRSGFG